MVRTHVSSKPDAIVLRSTNGSEQSGAYKPHGFWYEVDGDWRRWCEAEDFNRGGNLYLHRVNLADCNVLFVNALAKLDEFHAAFARPMDFGNGRHSSIVEIDWLSVAEQWDGVEIAPYQWMRRMAPDFMWYYGWDCASGVIWRPRNATVTYIEPLTATPLKERATW